MSLSDLSTGFSAARFAMNPTPLGAAGLIGGAMFGGKGGSKPPRKMNPAGDFGNYTIGGRKFDASPHTLAGDKGTYNLLALGASPTRDQVVQSLGNDQKALATYNAVNPAPRITPSTAVQAPKIAANLVPKARVPASPLEGRPSTSTAASLTLNPINRGTQIGLLEKDVIANYAKKQGNPFLISNQPQAPQKLAQALLSPPAYMTPQAAMAARA